MKTSTLIQTISKKLASATNTVTNEIADLRRRIDDTRNELQRARSAPVPREEINERIELAVEQSAEEWLKRSQNVVEGPGRLGDAHLRGRIRLPWSTFQPLEWGALCAGAPDHASAILTGLVDATEYEPGAGAAERPALIERLEAELAELEQAEELLVDEAAEAGVQIAHRPEVVERRQRERLDREAEEHRVRDRRLRQEAVDAAHASRRRTSGRSPYLEALAAQNKFDS